jgi:tRNA U34 5-carboxymethylaminomethyl modifying GTPase MnmE/TrmE
LGLISDIEARVDAAALSAKGEVSAEIEALKKEISELRVEIEADVNASESKVEELINNIKISTESIAHFCSY